MSLVDGFRLRRINLHARVLRCVTFEVITVVIYIRKLRSLLM